MPPDAIPCALRAKPEPFCYSSRAEQVFRRGRGPMRRGSALDAWVEPGRDRVELPLFPGRPGPARRQARPSRIGAPGRPCARRRSGRSPTLNPEDRPGGVEGLWSKPLPGSGKSRPDPRRVATPPGGGSVTAGRLPVEQGFSIEDRDGEDDDDDCRKRRAGARTREKDLLFVRLAG